MVGSGDLDPKEHPPGTETIGSPESKEEFPDRMKMNERKIRKIHKKVIKKIKINVGLNLYVNNNNVIIWHSLSIL